MNKPAALLRRVVDRISTESNIRNWRQLLAPLRAEPRPECLRTVLFCNLMTMPSTAKVEALMAGLLRLKGYRAVVLLEDRSRAIEDIFRAAVPDVSFVYLNGGVERAQAEAASTMAEVIVAKARSLQELVTLEIDGFRIGRNVQSLVLRKFRLGRLDDANTKHRDATLETLARSLQAKSFAEKLLGDLKPDLAIFVERGYTPAAEIFDACIMRGTDAIQWCGAPQSDCLIYRRYDRQTRGEHTLALSDETWNRLLKMPWTVANDQMVVDRIVANYKSGAWYNRQRLQEDKAILSPDDVRRALRLDPSKKTAVIFCHILYDATFFYGESLFEDYEHWLVESVRSAVANPLLNWVVKVHPVNIWRSRMDGVQMVQLEAATLQKHFGVLPDHIKIMEADTGINTMSLFEVADYGLTVRGTIGMELPCFGIPVVTAGTGRYSGRGFTIDPGSRQEYADILARLHELPRLDDDQIRRARRHYYGALSLRPVPMRSFVLDFQARAPLSGVTQPDVRLMQKADASLLETEDLGRLIRWLTQSKVPELLARDI